jgi:mRNA interferase MazF
MRRGDVRLIDFEPTRGAEANKRRPAVIVSNDGANSVVTVVPITSNVQRVYPFQVLIPARASGLRQRSKAQAEQVRAVAVERVGDLLGRLPNGVIAELDEALRLHLAL